MKLPLNIRQLLKNLAGWPQQHLPRRKSFIFTWDLDQCVNYCECRKNSISTDQVLICWCSFVGIFYLASPGLDVPHVSSVGLEVDHGGKVHILSKELRWKRFKKKKSFYCFTNYVYLLHKSVTHICADDLLSHKTGEKIMSEPPLPKRIISRAVITALVNIQVRDRKLGGLKMAFLPRRSKTLLLDLSVEQKWGGGNPPEWHSVLSDYHRHQKWARSLTSWSPFENSPAPCLLRAMTTPMGSFPFMMGAVNMHLVAYLVCLSTKSLKWESWKQQDGG